MVISWHIDKKDCSEATLALKHAESCITSELNPRILSMIHNKLGYMNRKDSYYPQAFFYFQKAMAIDKQEKFMDWYVSDLTNIKEYEFKFRKGDEDRFYLRNLSA